MSTGHLAARPSSTFSKTEINFYSTDSFSESGSDHDPRNEDTLIFSQIKEMKYGILLIKGNDKISRLILKIKPIIYQDKKFSSIGFYYYSKMKRHMVFIYYFPFGVNKISSLHKLCEFPGIDEICFIPVKCEDNSFIELTMEIHHSEKVNNEEILAARLCDSLFPETASLEDLLIWKIFSKCKEKGFLPPGPNTESEMISLPLPERRNEGSENDFNFVFFRYLLNKIIAAKDQDITHFFLLPSSSSPDNSIAKRKTSCEEIGQTANNLLLLVEWSIMIKTIFIEALNTGILYLPRIEDRFNLLTKHLMKISSDLKKHLPPDIKFITPSDGTNNADGFLIRCLYNHNTGINGNGLGKSRTVKTKKERRIHSKLVSILSEIKNDLENNREIVFPLNDFIDATNELAGEDDIIVEKISGEFTLPALCSISGLTNYEIPVTFSNSERILIATKGTDFSRFNDDQLRELTIILDQICQTNSQFVETRNVLARFRAEKTDRSRTEKN